MITDTPMTGYVTRYWETKGIIQRDDLKMTDPLGLYMANVSGGYFWGAVGRDVFLNRTDALADVEKRAAKRLKGLRAKILKIEKMVKGL